jgi:cytochrome c
MKKTIIGLLMLSTFYACGGGAGSGASEKKDPTQNPVFIAGQELVNKSGCLTCHKVNEASTGPSYKSVAAKYPNNVDTYENLALKIIKGGSGNWGQIPMIPHPTLSQEDATTMVKYILLLKD